MHTGIRKRKAHITACAGDTAKPAARDRKVLLRKTTRRWPDSGQRKIRFYPPRSVPLIQSRFCGNAIRDIYGNAALRRRFTRQPLPLLQKRSKCAVYTPSGTADRMGYKTEWKHRPLLRPLYEQCAIPLDLSQGAFFYCLSCGTDPAA